MPNNRKSGPVTISQRLNGIQDFTKASPELMAFVLDVKEQIYKLYLRGKFDNSNSVKQDKFLARVIMIDEQFDKRIEEINQLKEKYKKFGKRKTKFRDSVYKNAPQKPVKKSVKTSTLKEQDLNGKG